MVGLVIASHGNFCDGLKQSCEMIAGEISQCKSIPLVQSDTPELYGERLKNAIEATEDGAGVLILTDIRGGTPFNQALLLALEHNVIIVVGSNLPMLLTLVLRRDEKVTLQELAKLAKQEARESIDIIAYDGVIKEERTDEESFACKN